MIININLARSANEFKAMPCTKSDNFQLVDHVPNAILIALISMVGHNRIYINKKKKKTVSFERIHSVPICQFHARIRSMCKSSFSQYSFAKSQYILQSV